VGKERIFMKQIFNRFFAVSMLLISSLIILAQTAQANAIVTTDRADYAPGDTVNITGSGFLSGETVVLQVINLTNPNDNGAEHTPWEVTADAAGSFISSWGVTPNEVNSRLRLTATGLTSGQTAQVEFDDGDYDTVTVGSQTGTLTYGSNQVATFAITLSGKTGGNSVTVNLTATGLPAGATFGFTPNNFSASAATTTSTLYVTNGITTSAGTSTLSVTYSVISGNGSVIVNKAPLGITANNDSKTYGQSKTYGTNQTTFTSSGLKNSQTIGSVTITASGGTATNAAVGTYTLTPSAATGGTFSAANYLISYTNGTLTVNKATTAVSVASSLNPSGYKASINFTASLPAAATGSVIFLTNGVALCTSNLVSGLATSLAITNLSRGTNIITAQYAGDSNYSGSTNILSGGQIVTNHAPVASTAIYSRSLNSFKIFKSDFLATACTDADGDTLVITATGISTNGVSLLSNPVFLGYINANNVNDQFTYTVSDGFGGIATGTIRINFTPFVTGQNGTINASNGLAHVAFHGIPGFLYDIQRSTNMVDWTTIQTTNTPSGGRFQFDDNFNDLGSAPASAYYRLKWNP
jgi:hypothetical protein